VFAECPDADLAKLDSEIALLPAAPWRQPAHKHYSVMLLVLSFFFTT
jgi:hypothetical protein